MIGLNLGKRLDPGSRPPIRGILRLIASVPFIYAVAIPVLLLDFTVTLYQKICFPLFGIPNIRRSDYVLFRRVPIAGLNIFDHFNCYYCSYTNGVLRYAQQVAAATERMWCPIRQHRRPDGKHPEHHRHFVESGGRREVMAYYDHYMSKRDDDSPQ